MLFSENYVYGLSITLEQCWRDTLKILWGYQGRDEEFNQLLPGTKPLTMAATSANQFLLSRSMVHKRPLQVWKDLFHILVGQPLCHLGEPDYEHLYEYKRIGKKIREKPWYNYPNSKESPTNPNGYIVPGMAGEHLSHVIFGLKDLISAKPTLEDMCENFLPGCLGSPCKGSHLSHATTVIKTHSPANIVWYMVLYKGKRHNIPNMDTLNGLDVPSEYIATLAFEEVKKYAEGPPLVPCDKTQVPNACKESVFYKALHGTV